MTNAFSTAINTLFADPNLKKVAVYIPSQGPSKHASVITHKPSTFVSIADSHIAIPTLIINVLVSDCPNLAVGDKFLINAKMHTVQGEPRIDEDNLSWRVDVACD